MFLNDQFIYDFYYLELPKESVKEEVAEKKRSKRKAEGKFKFNFMPVCTKWILFIIVNFYFSYL